MQVLLMLMLCLLMRMKAGSCEPVNGEIPLRGSDLDAQQSSGMLERVEAAALQKIGRNESPSDKRLISVTKQVVQGEFFRYELDIAFGVGESQTHYICKATLWSRPFFEPKPEEIKVQSCDEQ